MNFPKYFQLPVFWTQERTAFPAHGTLGGAKRLIVTSTFGVSLPRKSTSLYCPLPPPAAASKVRRCLGHLRDDGQIPPAELQWENGLNEKGTSVVLNHRDEGVCVLTASTSPS